MYVAKAAVDQTRFCCGAHEAGSFVLEKVPEGITTEVGVRNWADDEWYDDNPFFVCYGVGDTKEEAAKNLLKKLCSHDDQVGYSLQFWFVRYHNHLGEDDEFFDMKELKELVEKYGVPITDEYTNPNTSNTIQGFIITNPGELTIE